MNKELLIKKWKMGGLSKEKLILGYKSLIRIYNDKISVITKEYEEVVEYNTNFALTSLKMQKKIMDKLINTEKELILLTETDL